jgi:ABC-type branched-subunit amino acid transport system substrate-binding protein
MHLHRVTPDPFQYYTTPTGGKYLGKEADTIEADVLKFDGEPPEQVVVAKFKRFGGGEHRKSDYEVLSTWQDVKAIIAKFSETGHPEAVSLQRALELAKMLKQMGWHEPEISN